MEYDLYCSPQRSLLEVVHHSDHFPGPHRSLLITTVVIVAVVCQELNLFVVCIISNILGLASENFYYIK